MPNYWLMKAEPESRIVKGKDVKFSVDDFETTKTTPWEGVRNHEAKNIMKEMKVGDEILFYHSSCKIPGVAAFAKVSREAYPDYTAWDSSHPYFDAKSNEEEPKWFMIDATFNCRATHFVPLALFRYVADLPTPDPPDEIEYIGRQGVKRMDLVGRGRLSVQRVNEGAWQATKLLAEKGGWDDLDLGRTKGKNSAATKRKRADQGSTGPGKSRKKAKATDDEDAAQSDEDGETRGATCKVPVIASQPTRRSRRVIKSKP